MLQDKMYASIEEPEAHCNGKVRTVWESHNQQAKDMSHKEQFDAEKMEMLTLDHE